MKSCPGSAYVALGDSETTQKTEVIASVVGPRPAQKGLADRGELNVKVQYSPFNNKVFEDNSPEVKRFESDIHQCFQGVVLLDQYPKSRID